jgi:hypothetical protein
MQPPKQVPPQLLVTVLAHMINNNGRGNDELLTAFASVVAERHRHFHVSEAHPETDWLKCAHQFCCQMGRILARAREPKEVKVTPSDMNAAANLRVLFDVHPNCMRVFTEKRSAIEQPRIIIP